MVIFTVKAVLSDKFSAKVYSSSLPVVSYCISTASTDRPSCRRIRSLRVPSPDVWHCSTVDENRTKSRSSSSQAALGRSWMAVHSTAGSRSRCL